ncbi:DNA-directed RNA polymerase, omega subunit [Desulfosudis oleivorans Hxd3]|uniref:DNA-directed RNA polymerase subunit omega n=1 Tax=Desulfosudis oleivorans (strain DSM 6200 / JCM 39069 / Hxd3) TaxID=96561 RepID=A8ZUJ4_DESOH|nr:DNA-directed RNA polymerase, omega subunit [Desulfosudis oleivorans Hxd3]
MEDCLRKVPSRFELVHLAAQRVRQIREGSEYLVISPKNEDIVVALREIAAGKITQENMAAALASGFFKADAFENDGISEEIAEEMTRNMNEGAGLADSGLETREDEDLEADGDEGDDEDDA